MREIYLVHQYVIHIIILIMDYFKALLLFGMHQLNCIYLL